MDKYAFPTVNCSRRTNKRRYITTGPHPVAAIEKVVVAVIKVPLRIMVAVKPRGSNYSNYWLLDPTYYIFELWSGTGNSSMRDRESLNSSVARTAECFRQSYVHVSGRQVWNRAKAQGFRG